MNPPNVVGNYKDGWVTCLSIPNTPQIMRVIGAYEFSLKLFHLFLFKFL